MFGPPLKRLHAVEFYSRRWYPSARSRSRKLDTVVAVLRSDGRLSARRDPARVNYRVDDRPALFGRLRRHRDRVGPLREEAATEGVRGFPRGCFEPGRGADPFAHFFRPDFFAAALEEPLGKSPSP